MQVLAEQRHRAGYAAAIIVHSFLWDSLKGTETGPDCHMRIAIPNVNLAVWLPQCATGSKGAKASIAPPSPTPSSSVHKFDLKKNQHRHSFVDIFGHIVETHVICLFYDMEFFVGTCGARKQVVSSTCFPPRSAKSG